MSIDVTQWAWQVPDLPPTTKLVLLHLADKANKYPHHYAWPTVKGICSDTGLARRTVQRALELLRERELIVPIGYGGKTGQAVVYALMGRWSKQHRRWEERGRHGDARWRHSDTPRGVTRDEGGVMVTPQGRHGGAHNRKTTVSNLDQPPGAPLGERAGVGDQPPGRYFETLKQLGVSPHE